MLDANTLAVSYDYLRGEPRGNKKRVPESGDCVDCTRCLQVCPTGIDIRNGNQLECIHCTACIDACDAVMTKMGRDRGLIRYASEHALAGKKVPLIRFRSMIYLCALIFLITLTTYMLTHRSLIDVTLLRGSGDRGERITLPNGQLAVRKHFEISLVNKTLRPLPITIDLPHRSAGSLIGPMVSGEVPVGTALQTGVYVTMPADAFENHQLMTHLIVRYQQEDHSGLDKVAIKLPRPKPIFP